MRSLGVIIAPSWCQHAKAFMWIAEPSETANQSSAAKGRALVQT